MEYIARDYNHNKHNYSFSYVDLKKDYNNIKNYSNKQFLENIPKILHFTIFVGYIKEWNLEESLSDYSIIHDLVHLLNDIDLSNKTLDNLRILWDHECRL